MSVELALVVLALACVLGALTTTIGIANLIVDLCSALKTKVMWWLSLSMLLFVCFWMEANGVVTYQFPRVSGISLGCQYNGKLVKLQEMLNLTRTYLCSISCPCLWDSGNLPYDSTSLTRGTAQQWMIATGRPNFSQTSGANRIQECPNYNGLYVSG